MTDVEYHTLEVDGLPDPLLVIDYHGHEAISSCFEISVTVSSDDAFIAFQDVLGKNAHLKLACSQESSRHFHGIIQRFEFAFHRDTRTAYRAVLVPMAWRLKMRENNRIFQEMTAIDIIEAVLREAMITHQFSVINSYATREYCVQYRETDWDFINRLMEEEGVFFFFKHSEEEAELMIVDSPNAYQPIPGNSTLKYHSGALATEEHIQSLYYGEEVRPGKVSTRDYNFKTPDVLLEAKAVAERDADLELYGYPGNYLEGNAGKALASRRLEAHQATLRSGRGESDCGRLMPGFKFSLEDAAQGDLRDDLVQDYVVTRVEHRGGQAHGDSSSSEEAVAYRNRFWVVPAQTPFRIVPRTPRPTINGIQTAVVVGPAGEEIHTDEHGRVKVQFHWDRQGKKDDGSSCWIRVRQPWAGIGWGTLFLPRIGQEVVVEFIEGDPDRPLVSGAVYHAANAPPYSLPGDKTKSTIKSNSSTGGGGSNELRFEDLKDSEEIYLHGQKDWNVVIENDKTQSIGHDESLTVDNDQTIHVQHDRNKTVDNDQSETVGGNKQIDVTGDHTETVGGNHTETISGNEEISIKGAETLTVSRTRSVSVTLAHDEKVGLNQQSSVGGAFMKSVGGVMSLTVGGSKTESIGQNSSDTVRGSISVKAGKDYAATIGKKMMLKVGDDRNEDVGKKMSLVVGEKLQIQCGSATVVIEKDGKVSVKGKDITVSADGDIKVKAKKLSVKSDGAVNVKASGKVAIKGSKVGVN